MDLGTDLVFAPNLVQSHNRGQPHKIYIWTLLYYRIFLVLNTLDITAEKNKNWYCRCFLKSFKLNVTCSIDFAATNFDTF